MYLHIGGEYSVKISDIVAILDMDNTTIAKASRNFLSVAQKRGEIINTTDEIPKSYIITYSNKETKVYLSSLLSSTLLKRTEAKNNDLFGESREYFYQITLKGE